MMVIISLKKTIVKFIQCPHVVILKPLDAFLINWGRGLYMSEEIIEICAFISIK